MKKALKRLQPVIGILVSLILLYIVLFKPQFKAWSDGDLSLFAALFSVPRIQFADLVTAWHIIDFWYAGLAILLLILSLFIRTFRWKIIIEEVGPTSFWTVFHSMNVGYMLNNILPLRAGELLRGIIVGRRSNLPSTAMIASVVVERIFDLAGLVVAFGSVIAFYPFPGWVRGAGGALSIVILVMLITAVVLSHSTNRLKKWNALKLEGKPKILQTLRDRFLELLDGLSVLKSGKAMIHVTWTSLSLTTIYILVMQVVLSAFHFTDGTYPLLAEVPFVKAAVLTLITSLGFAIPSAPGGVGTYHASVLLGLSWFDVPEGLAVIFAAVMHAVNYITLTLFGFIGLWRLKLSFSDVLKTSRGENDAETGTSIPEEE